jgi:phosphate transport system permease protein
MATVTQMPARPAPAASGPDLRAVAPRRKVKNHVMTGLVTLAFLVAMAPLVSVVWTVVAEGVGQLGPDFFRYSMRGVIGGARQGGINHAILGTVLITGAATAISVPLGLFTAIYLVEYGRGPLARAVTFFVDVMTGIPSIVAGLFAYALFAVFFGPGAHFGLMGAVALSVLMTPVVVRSGEEMLRLVPNELREASLALGVPKWLTIVKVVLRTSVAGLTTGVMLAIARVIGETAPLLVAVGVADSINTDLLDGRMMTLPVFIYTSWHKGYVPCSPGATDCNTNINFERAWAAALTLIAIVMLLNLIARLVARYFAPKAAHR